MVWDGRASCDSAYQSFLGIFTGNLRAEALAWKQDFVFICHKGNHCLLLLFILD